MRRIGGLITLAQGLLALRVLRRMAATLGGERIGPASGADTTQWSVAVLLPILNEADRLRGCLDRLVLQGDAVSEIIVIDGGSTDGSLATAQEYARQDGRIRVRSWTGESAGRNQKALQLQSGVDLARDCPWILTIDADVRVEPELVDALVSFAGRHGYDVLSVATAQKLSGAGEALVHPSMLTTLVYRFGVPGGRQRRVETTQANGQCFLVRREALNRVGGFAAVAGSLTEDVTLARALVDAGFRVGFHETDGLATTEMYGGFDEALDNWTRSLPMRDRYAGSASVIGLAEVLFVQALPLVRGVRYRQRGARGIGPALNRVLLGMRLGVLAGTARAYPGRPLTYWLSPVMDMPVALRLIRNYVRRTHTWRGRTIVNEG
ncbi:MAG: glycosyltransferase [Chloroflexota bacterium]|nr:glycosyltransferase [Chloroflexota bacterium]